MEHNTRINKAGKNINKSWNMVTNFRQKFDFFTIPKAKFPSYEMTKFHILSMHEYTHTIQHLICLSPRKVTSKVAFSNDGLIFHRLTQICGMKIQQVSKCLNRELQFQCTQNIPFTIQGSSIDHFTVIRSTFDAQYFDATYDIANLNIIHRPKLRLFWHF